MLLKKISAKNIVGNVKALCLGQEDGTIIDLANFYGRATGFKTGESTYGGWVALVGNFEAVDLRTGEESQAPQIFLVEPLQGMILASLATAECVDFACKMSIKVNSELPTGYEYVVTPLTEVTRSDALSALRLIAGKDTVKVLAAPEVLVEELPKTKKK